MLNQKVYTGWLGETYGDGYDELGISISPDTPGVPLVEIIEKDMYEHGSYLSVRYFISDKVATLQELEKDFMETVYGKAEADFCRRYSDYTGYLWTDEKLNVGGHDLLKELKSYKGKFICIEIKYSKSAKKTH